MRVMNMRAIGTIAVGLIVAASVAMPADARRGGSFGSRGARTHSAPAATAVAPRQTAPVQRSMTERPAGQQGMGQQQAGRASPARSGGMMKGVIGGLIAGGLIGALLGNGLGSLAGTGFLMALLQVALIGGLAWLLFRMFRRRQTTPAPAFAGASQAPFMAMEPRPAPAQVQSRGFASVSTVSPGRDIDIDDADRQTFERLLVEVQDAFGNEDYARLRERTTPEIMSYFAEELSQNATGGRRNQVSGTTLIDAEVSEAWQEGATDYATIAMRYESVDVMLDRNTGAVLTGDPARPTQATELWTFARDASGAWRLSAVQEA